MTSITSPAANKKGFGRALLASSTGLALLIYTFERRDQTGSLPPTSEIGPTICNDDKNRTAINTCRHCDKQGIRGGDSPDRDSMTPAQAIGVLVYASVLASVILGLCLWVASDMSRAQRTREAAGIAGEEDDDDDDDDDDHWRLE